MIPVPVITIEYRGYKRVRSLVSVSAMVNDRVRGSRTRLGFVMQ